MIWEVIFHQLIKAVHFLAQIFWYYMQPSTAEETFETHDENNDDVNGEEAVEENCETKHINSLPFNVLLKIFSYLTFEDRILDACLVCKYWYQICHNGMFWQDIDFEDRKRMTDEILLKSVTHSNVVTSLNLCDIYGKKLTKDGIVEATKACPHLRTLILKGSICGDLGDIAMIEISENCPKLQRLETEGQSLSDLSAVLGFAENLTNLEHLNISQNPKITNDGVTAIIKCCHNLKKLKIEQLFDVSDEFLKALAKRETEEARMEYLNLSMCGVTNKGAIFISRLTNLRFLDLTKCQDLGPEEVRVIVQNTTKLTHFYVAMLNSFNDKCVEYIVIHLKHLIELYFGSSTITDTAMEHIAKHGTKTIERVDVPYSKVTHIGAKLICEALPNLRRIGMTRCDDADEAELEVLVQRFPKIAFSTFLQDAKRMLIRAGQWPEDDRGVVTQELIMERLHSSKPKPRQKPRRLIATGGKIEYVDFIL